jgi:hypothetical protein
MHSAVASSAARTDFELRCASELLAHLGRMDRRSKCLFSGVKQSRGSTLSEGQSLTRTGTEIRRMSDRIHSTWSEGDVRRVHRFPVRELRTRLLFCGILTKERAQTYYPGQGATHP